MFMSREIQAIRDRDPAARTTLEIVLASPGLHALAIHRAANALWRRGFKLPGRLVSHLGRFLTGIEIHPGATIGRGVWCETYWLPEADLVTLGDGATVERGCVVQTHLFHDRIMSMDTVTLGAGATLGPHCVALPAAGLGDGATVGPASLVMRGDVVPASTRWQGNPIAPWNDSMPWNDSAADGAAR